MAGREAPAHAHIAKQVDGARAARNPRAPAQDARCPGAAAQLGAVHRTLRHGTVLQLREGGAAAGGQPGAAPRAGAANRTGLPDRLKAGVEALSGISLDGLKVHHDSSKPARLNALAYARGGDIHLAPGQERHLPHEAWHIVQQAQRRVRPTRQLRGGAPVNDDKGLEQEADAMGARARENGNRSQAPTSALAQLSPSPVAQMVVGIRDISIGSILVRSDKMGRYKVTKINGNEVEVTNCETGDVEETFDIKGWDNVYDLEVQPEGARSSSSGGPASPSSVAEEMAEHKEAEEAPKPAEASGSGSASEATKLPATEKYPTLTTFSCPLPQQLGVLEWIDQPQYFTENGWMSTNMHVDLAHSRNVLGGEAGLSVHAIIAVKEVAGGITRINPHVTVRDQKRQLAREQREESRYKRKKGYQMPALTKEEKRLNEEDADYSVQYGLKSTRILESKLKVGNLSAIFSDTWIRGIARCAIETATSKLGTRPEHYQLGTVNHQFVELEVEEELGAGL